jgi:DNA-binding transcriptional LysR family regulator
MLNLEWFRTFKAIYETGTLSAAAEVLFISQPGVSLHLSQLENYSGHRLFEKEKRRMKPTDRATMLYNSLKEPLGKLENAEKLFHGKSKSEKPAISLGMCFETFQQTLEEQLPGLPFNVIIRFDENQKMLHDLNDGALDLILTPQVGQQATLEYVPFATSKILMVCGNETDTNEFDELIKTGNRAELKKWLKGQIWYTTAAYIENLNNFWLHNFGSRPDFKPNFIIPYHSSILRCLSGAKGFAIIPDFMCKEHLEKDLVKLAWKGFSDLEATLYWAKRKKTVYGKEITQLEQILTKNWFA